MDGNFADIDLLMNINTMKKKTITLTAVSLVVASCVMAQTHPFQDESLSFHERAKNLVSLLTLEEKINQVGHQTLAIPRLRPFTVLPVPDWLLRSRYRKRCRVLGIYR